jgi:hypothetical protein
MKIGIMTFWWSDDNYGQILQCYALQKYLRDAGHDAYLIRYDPRNDYVKTPLWRMATKAFNPVVLANYFHYKIRKYNDRKEKLYHSRHFDAFRNEYIKNYDKIYYSYDKLVTNQPEADVYITGSDQVWNPDFLLFKNTKNQTKAYFLDFAGVGKKRIAYAVSFGKERLDDDFIGEITPLLKKFSYVSVREKSGLDICRQCGVKAEWVPDPTMLLNADVYRSLYNNAKVKISVKPYCFLYILGNKHNFSIKTIYNWAANRNLEIIYVTGNAQQDNYQKIYATIPEWIYLIDKADYVITNSYHCAVFSIFFQKNFCIIPLTGKDKNMNERFISLYALFNIESRYINTDFSIFNNNINWNNIREKLSEISLFDIIPILF